MAWKTTYGGWAIFQAGQTRLKQQERELPPEPEVVLGEGEEIPLEKAEAAKRRLGRSGLYGNTDQASEKGKKGEN